MSAHAGIDAPFTVSGHPVPGDLPEDFLAVAAAVYADDPLWIPEDGAALRHRFSAANPWFERGEAQLWYVPGRARLAAFVSPGTVVDGVPSAFFGYWETLGPDPVDAALFERAAGWARQRGARRLYGPIDFTTFGRYRLRTGGDATVAPFPQEPYHPGHYPDVLTALGFTPAAKTYASLVVSPDLAGQLAAAFRPQLDAVRARGFRFEPLTAERWLAELAGLHPLCDVVFGEQFAYTPITFDEFATACGPGFARRLAPDLSVIALDPDDRVAGFLVNNPDWGPLLAQGNPDRLRADDLDHDRHRPLLAERGPAHALIRTGGALPEHRRLGLATAALAIVFDQIATGDWDGATVGIVTEGNAIDHLLRRYDPPVRTYALYERDL